jgi:RNA polymerase sigma-70 factor (ECF subfamily)
LPESASMAEEPCAGGLQDFDSLVRQHRPRIFRFLLASLRDKEAAENLTQDCFVRAYRARDHFRGGSSLGTWLMHIAANLVRDHEANGRLKFWRRHLRSDVDLTDISDWIPDQHKSPEALALAKEQVEAVWKRLRVYRRGSEPSFCCASWKTWISWRSSR